MLRHQIFFKNHEMYEEHKLKKKTKFYPSFDKTLIFTVKVLSKF